MPGNCVHLCPRRSGVVYYLPSTGMQSASRSPAASQAGFVAYTIHPTLRPHGPQFPARGSVWCFLLSSGHHPTQVIVVLSAMLQGFSQVLPWLPVNSPPLLVSCSVQLYSHLWVSREDTVLYTPHHSALLQLRHLSMGAGTEGLPRLAALKLTWEIKGRSSLL